MTIGRDPEFASDKPMSASGSARMLKIAVERSGVEHISAHDLRRTHITLALDNGAPLQDMQAQAGHANASTTLRYPQAADAKARRERIAFQFTPALDATRAWSELSPLDDAAQSSSGITPHLRQ